MKRPLVILVCGGHVGIDPVKVSTWLIDHYSEFGPVAKVVEGGASGADAGGALFAKALGIEHVQVRADWDTYGKKAGPIRNQAMIRDHLPDLVFAFPGKAGTRDMIRQARRAGIEVQQVEGDFFVVDPKHMKHAGKFHGGIIRFY